MSLHLLQIKMSVKPPPGKPPVEPWPLLSHDKDQQPSKVSPKKTFAGQVKESLSQKTNFEEIYLSELKNRNIIEIKFENVNDSNNSATNKAPNDSVVSEFIFRELKIDFNDCLGFDVCFKNMF